MPEMGINHMPSYSFLITLYGHQQKKEKKLGGEQNKGAVKNEKSDVRTVSGSRSWFLT